MKNLYPLKFISGILFLFITQISISQTTYTIDDPEKLEDETYVAGDVIILKNGTYDTDERITFIGNGTEDNPITFRAETPGGVIFTGGLKMNIGGDYVVVDGFHWKGGYGASNFIQFRDGYDYANHSTIQNCAIDGLGAEPAELAEDLDDGQITKHRWIVLYGTYNTVINCTFMNKETSGALILGEYSYNAFPDGDDGVNESCNEVGHKIMNNYFYNFEKMDDLYAEYGGSDLSNAGDSETIRLGTSSYQMVNSNAIVSNNYFVKADGENEIITNKSKGNTYSNNTFRSCRGSLVLRHGSYGTIEGNYFLGENVDGTGGIRITDSYHSITNNYIQDCITVEDNAKWNNGITFIGGGDDADVACTSDDVSNGYQQTEGITVSNNTIINTNAPLFYNEDKGSTDPTGSVMNNLIYFAESNANISEVISGDSDTAYNNMGTALTYTGNVYTGTTLGVTNDGFTEETGISATENGEIFTISGADGKGADMGAYEPTTDDMVGYGIGACFIDYAGVNITDGDCTIEVLESISVSSLSTLGQEAGSYDVTVSANVSWTAVSNDDWITIDVTSGTNETVSVTVTENTLTDSRTGTVTFTQDAGGDDIVKTLTVTQEGVPLTYGLNLINDGSDDDNVVVYSVFHEEITDSKNNIAINSLDKDIDTQWSGNNDADASDITEGTNVGEIIYDLGGSYELQLVDYMATNGKTYEFQIFVSTTTADDDAFTNAFDDSNLVCATEDDEFTSYLLPTAIPSVKYVKIIGYGQPSKPSSWNTIVEIEFYGNDSDPNGDDDSDGVLNGVDLCANTPTGEIVDENGCSNGQLDDDEDGVINSDDLCADTPIGEDVNDEGCAESQLDEDQDGVMNDVDECPNTPIGETVNATGCAESELDDDEDGVMNDVDECLNTTAGVTVNSVGCFTLSSTNFDIETTGETCADQDNGIITITATESLNYSTTINGTVYTFTNTLTVDGLEPGAIEFCITVDGETFEQCFNVTIEEGESVAGKSSLQDKQLLVELSNGTLPYKVYLNNVYQFETYNSSFSIEVSNADLVEVKTNYACQGVYSKEVDLIESLTAYPNPSENLFNITIPTNEDQVSVEVFNSTSQLVISGLYEVSNSGVQFSLLDKPAGIYIVKVYLDKVYTFKVVKI